MTLLRACTLFFAALALVACDSDRSTRSPDLPADTLDSIVVECQDPPGSATFSQGPITMAVGQSTQCVAECVYRSVDKNGNTNLSVPGSCNGLSWSAGTCLTVNGQGVVTATCQSPGTPVTGSVDEGSDSVNFIVTPVAVSCSEVFPIGAPEPAPPLTCNPAPAGTYSISRPAGVTVDFRAAVLLNNGTRCYAPTVSAAATAAGFNPCPANLVTFAATDQGSAPPTTAVADFPNPANGIARTKMIGDSDVTATGSGGQHVDLAVVPATLNNVCVELNPVAGGCTSIVASNPTAACTTVTTNPTVSQTPGPTKQFYAHAFFDVGTAVAQVCDVTDSVDTTWSITSVGTNAAANPTVNNGVPAATNKGEVSGGGAPTTNAMVQAEHTNNAITRSDEHPFDVVVDSLVLGTNSLILSSIPIANNPATAETEADHAACVASINELDGPPLPLQLSTQARLFGIARYCLASTLTNGRCPAPAATDVLVDVTNFVAGAQVPGTITWTIDQKMQWDTTTETCIAPSTPLQAILGPLTAEQADVGDALAANYVNSPAFDPPGAPDGRVAGDKGVAIGLSTLGSDPAGFDGIGVACVRATYTEGAVTTEDDGVSVVVFPANDGSWVLDPATGALTQPLCPVASALLQ
jgi:hypothetical protein